MNTLDGPDEDWPEGCVAKRYYPVSGITVFVYDDEPPEPEFRWSGEDCVVQIIRRPEGA